MTLSIRLAAMLVALFTVASLGAQSPEPQRVRARALGVAPGIFTPGPNNAITDVAGVLVGHATIVVGDSLRTGVTAIVPHAGDLYRSRVPAALHVGNGYGKLLGATQLRELGELETPIVLTCTLCIWQAGDALARHMLALPGNENVRSINPVIGETNDGVLNATRDRPGIGDAVRTALQTARDGAVPEGSVGAGAGTVMFGWKGGIGTSSRVLPDAAGGYSVGVLVQTNYGGVLQVLGAPVGQALNQYSFQRMVAPVDSLHRDKSVDESFDESCEELFDERGDGSIMIVVATDAPLLDRNLERLAARAIMGLAHTGSNASNGSGDYVIAFSTAESVRRSQSNTRDTLVELSNESLSPLFQAVVEATEEAIYNALFMASTTSSRAATVPALPLDAVRDILRRPVVK